MTRNKLTADDIEHLRECWLAAREDDALADGPEPVMTSLGYVDLWSDGEVTFSPGSLGSFDDDGDWSGETGETGDDGEE